MQETLREVVTAFVVECKGASGVEVSLPFVANAVVEKMPHAGDFTVIEREAAYIGTAQVAREVLRKQHDEEYDPKHISNKQFEFYEASLLNGGYSVLRGSEPVYVPRQRMTRDDMEYVCAKFDALAGHFARASRALRADFERRNVSAAA